MLSRRSFLALAAASPVPWLVAGAARGAEPAICAPDGLALGGHDAVAYFTAGRAVDGVAANAIQWRGALWLFSSDEASERFMMTPRAFAPQFGGYCAMSLAQGVLAAGDPTIWEIRHGRLFLLRSKAARHLWDSDVATNLAAAEDHWPSVLQG